MTYVMNEGFGEKVLPCVHLARSLCPHIQACVKEILFKSESMSSKAFVFCDFGAADGASSSVLLSAVASEIERAGGPNEISVVLEDQEENDFQPVFQYIHRAMKEGNAGRPNVVVSTVGRSFYEQCVPSDSLHFATSLFAAQYLDTSRPSEGHQTGFSLPLLRRWRQVGRDMSALTEEERAHFTALSEKAAADWERFLLRRAKELRVGGQIMIAALATVPEDIKDFRRYSDGVIQSLDDEFTLTADAVHEMVEEGEIGEDEEQNFCVPEYLRTLEEAKAPFLEANSTVRLAGLQLRHAEYVIADHPRAIERENILGLNEAEVVKMATSYCDEIRTSPMVRQALAKSSTRSKNEVDRLVREVFQRVEKGMITSRAIFMGWALFLVVVEKVTV